MSLRLADRTIVAEHVVITAGPWLGQAVAELDLPLAVTREQTVHFEVAQPNRFEVGRLPVFVDYETSIYGFPHHERFGVKLTVDHSGVCVDAESLDRNVDSEYIAKLANWLRRWMPSGAAGSENQSVAERLPRATSSAVCLYTCTPDRDFIIDRHPAMPNVHIAGGFSGHGFKFSVLVGDILADLVIDGATNRAIDNFRISRFVADADG